MLSVVDERVQRQRELHYVGREREERDSFLALLNWQPLHRLELEHECKLLGYARKDEQSGVDFAAELREWDSR